LQKYPEGRKKEYISWVVKQANGNKTKAAEILGIDRVSLWRKLKRYDLNGGREILGQGTGSREPLPLPPSPFRGLGER